MGLSNNWEQFISFSTFFPLSGNIFDIPENVGEMCEKTQLSKRSLGGSKMNLQRSTWKKSCVSEAKIAAFSLIKKTPPDPQGV